MDHYKRPRNTGEPESSDYLSEEGENSSCGDSTEIYVKIEGGRINDILHSTDACAIATAGISIISEKLVGMEVKKILELERDWVIDKLGIDVSPMRVKCAVLGLKTVQSCLRDNEYA